MRFPKVIKHRKAEVTIYGKTKGNPSYRIAYRVDGKRRMESFRTYSEAKTQADKLVKELAKGSPAAALSSAQARDAISALERLQTLYTATGRRVSLLAAVSEFAETSAKLNGRSLGDVVESYFKTTANVKRKDIAEAVEEYVATRKRLTEAKPEKRAQLSKHYVEELALWLRGFAKTFPATVVCDLGKEHLNTFMQKYDEHSPKSRNHYRGAVKMFLRWCVKSDYLPPTHRLFEADRMATEKTDFKEVDYFRPRELQAMLDLASGKPVFNRLLPVIAIGGLAGLRLEEVLRLDWAEVWRTKDHIEVKARNAKTRARRLVDICPALAEWLKPYRKFSGPVFEMSIDTFHHSFAMLRNPLKIPARHNGLRHAFCTFHFALHANENKTAQQAGNTPSVMHTHYKGLAPKTEAERWFDVAPSKPVNAVAFASAA